MSDEELKSLVRLFSGDFTVFVQLYKSQKPSDDDLLKTTLDLIKCKEITHKQMNDLILFLSCYKKIPHFFD